ncbi:MAG: TerC family protein [Coriobacteriales bacterium]|nr:TerC family protein [Coriobacteriales bacterium]
MDFGNLITPLTTAEGWLSLLTLIFLELVLGIDNLVFISITTDRLPEAKKHLGRRFGLIAALIMRIILLCIGSVLLQLKETLFTLPFSIPFTDPHISAKELIIFLGGAYLVYKGIVEVLEKVSIEGIMNEHGPAADRKTGLISLPRAIGTIALMDMIFSLDSVLAALGLSGQILVMVIAVMLAVFVMIIFADPIAEFINKNPEMKILALCFIIMIGIKLMAESLGIEVFVEGTEIEVMDLMLYFAMGFSLVITCVQMLHNSRVKAAQELAEASSTDEEGEE